ncbi:MAG: hypothetical protein ACLTTH_16380 [Holdemanella porci]
MALPKNVALYIILNSNGDSITGTASLSWIRSKNYIMQSSIATRKMIRDSMDQYAAPPEAWKMPRGYQMGTHIISFDPSFTTT